jgi:hypothetical protein
MWIEAVAVSVLDAIVNMAEFRAKGSRTGHGGVDVQPQIMLPADAANLRHRINRI